MFRHHSDDKRLGRCRQKIAGVGVLAAAIFLLAPSTIFGQLSTGLEVVGSTGLGTSDVKTVIINIIRIFLGFLGLVAVVITLYGGFKWMTAAGDDTKIKTARKIIINGAIGAVIILAAYLIVNFVIGLFGSSLFGGNGNQTTPPPPEINIGALGGGVLRDVYPSPGAQNVPRNTLIMVTFKEKMATSSLIFKPSAKPDQCAQVLYDQNACGYLARNGNSANIQIMNLSASPVATLLPDRAVIMTNDGKTFVIRPIDPLGSASAFSNYKVVLTPQIQIARNNSAAFSGTGYGWIFTISNLLDVTPPQVVSVVPTLAAANVAKNSLIQINFSEAVNAITASGQVILGTLAQGVGTAAQFNSATNPFKTIKVYYANTDGSLTYVAGDFEISNGFKTVEFTPRARCTDSSGAAVQNSCGRDVFCLTGNQHFTVEIQAAAVNPATHETTDILSGVTDSAGNSLDGNKNGIADGPTIDNYQWQFSTNNQLDLDPPKIISPLTPANNQTAVPVNTPIAAQFNKPMSSASLISDYFAILKNGLVNGQSCVSGVSRLDPNDPTPNATIPFPPANLAACYPVGFAVNKTEVYLPQLQTTGTLASLKLFGDLTDNTDFTSRLSAKIQDLHQNCFNPAECAPNQPNCPDQSGHN